MGLACTEKASRAVGVVVRAACPAAAYGFDVELVSVLATRDPTVACIQALTPLHTALCCQQQLKLAGLCAVGLRQVQSFTFQPAAPKKRMQGCRIYMLWIVSNRSTMHAYGRLSHCQRQ